MSDDDPQQRATARLETLEPRWHQAIKGRHERVILVHADLRLSYINHGHPGAQDYLGTTLLDWTEPAYHDQTRRAARDALATGLPHHLSTQGAGPDGAPSEYSSWLIPLAGGHGAGAALLALSTDVSSLSRLQDALSETKGAFESLVCNAPDYILIVNRDYTIAFINRARPGAKAADIVGQELTEFVRAKQVQGLRDIIDAVFSSGQNAASEVIGGVGRSARLYTARFSPVLRGDVVHQVAVIARDVTEVREEERRLARERRFVAGLERVEHVMLGSDDTETLMGDVIRVLCEVFQTPWGAARADDDAITQLIWVAPDVPEPRLDGTDFELDEADREPKLIQSVRVRQGRSWTIRLGPAPDPTTRDHAGDATLLETVAHRLEDTLGMLASLDRVRLSEERYRSLLETAPEAIVVLDLDAGVLVEANGNAETLFGYDRQTLLSVQFNSLSPEYQPDGTRSDAAAAAMIAKATGTGPTGFEWVHRHASGETFPVEVRLTWVPHPTRTLLRGSITDIQDRKRAERELRRSQRLMEQAQGIALLGSWELDLTTRALRWSRGLFVLLDLDPDEVAPDFERVRSRVHPEDRFKFVDLRDAVSGVPGGPDAYDIEARMSRGDGSEWLMHAWGKVQFDASGQPVCVAGVVQDVTAQRTEAKEREALAAQLFQAQKMEAIGQLTGGVAHDFNNLLTVIQGSAEMLGEVAGEPEAVRALAEAISSASHRASALTQRLLAFSRKQALQPSPVDLNALIDGMNAVFLRTLGADVALHTRLEPQLWPCEVDSSQMENAVLNLALNARDAMPAGGRLSFRTRNMTVDADGAQELGLLRGGDFVCLDIGDEGHGMPSAIIDQVFEPFFTTKGVGKGSGLGLSMVYGFVKQSGGAVTIESTVGQGTTVSMWLPRATRAAGLLRQEGAGIIGPGTPGAGELVLVVEDEPDVRRFTVTMVEHLGYTTVSASDGDSALAALRAHPDVALMLTDVVLPGGMSGADIAMAAADIRPRMKVLFMSGYSRDALVNDGRLPPGLSLLNKPFKAARLAELVARLIAERGEDSQ